MAKGDATGGASSSGSAQAPKMDQYSVMHHLMTSMAPSMGPNKYGGGGRMGGQMGQPQSAPQLSAQPYDDLQNMQNQMGMQQQVAANYGAAPFGNPSGQMGTMISGLAGGLGNMGSQMYGGGLNRLGGMLRSISPQFNQNRLRQQPIQMPPADINQQQV
jgi:hypothetical protein